jgi:hypothetical protein
MYVIYFAYLHACMLLCNSTFACMNNLHALLCTRVALMIRSIDDAAMDSLLLLLAAGFLYDTYNMAQRYAYYRRSLQIRSSHSIMVHICFALQVYFLYIICKPNERVLCRP